MQHDADLYSKIEVATIWIASPLYAILSQNIALHIQYVAITAECGDFRQAEKCCKAYENQGNHGLKFEAPSVRSSIISGKNDPEVVFRKKLEREIRKLFWNEEGTINAYLKERIFPGGV